MTTPTSDAAEIERLAALVEWVVESYPLSATKTADMHTVAATLRAIPADNDRSRYKAQIEGLERERDEARESAEDLSVILHSLEGRGISLTPAEDREWQRVTSRLAAAKEKPDG